MLWITGRLRLAASGCLSPLDRRQYNAGGMVGQQVVIASRDAAGSVHGCAGSCHTASLDMGS